MLYVGTATKKLQWFAIRSFRVVRHSMCEGPEFFIQKIYFLKYTFKTKNNCCFTYDEESEINFYIDNVTYELFCV